MDEKPNFFKDLERMKSGKVDEIKHTIFYKENKCIHNIDEGETTLKWLKEVEMWYCSFCKKHMYEELVE